MRPLISIIIPTYNRAILLKETLESVMNQEYNNLQIIIVDDNSTEEIELLVREILQGCNYKFFKNNENKGGAYSRNFGVLQADGEYVSFLDSDDLIKVDKIEKLASKAEMTNADYIFSGWDWKNFEKDEILFSRIPDKKNGLIDGKPRWCFNIVPDLVKTDIFLKNPYNSGLKSYDHFDFTIKMFKNYEVAFVPEILSIFRDHQGLRSSSNIVDRIFSVDYLFENHEKMIIKERKFASGLRLSQGLYDWQTCKINYKKNFLEAIRLFPLNIKAYYHLIRTF